MSLEQVRSLSSEKLARLCRENNDLYKQDESASDDRYCDELIRRAIYRIDNADELFDEVYRPWLEYKVYAMCNNRELVDDLTQEALFRFFKYVTPDTWPKFSSLAHVLAYLNKCAEAAVLNFFRKSSRRREESDPTPEKHVLVPKRTSNRPIERDIGRRQMHQRLWDCVRRNCNDADDFFLAEQLWVYELKPGTIAQSFPDRFPQVTDIYKRKRNLVDRIKRDQECQTLVA